MGAGLACATLTRPARPGKHGRARSRGMLCAWRPSVLSAKSPARPIALPASSSAAAASAASPSMSTIVSIEFGHAQSRPGDGGR